MRKRNNYAVLQKKLKELESELNDVFAIEGERPCHELLSEGIERRLWFLRSLLSAEIESHPSGTPHHLHHIHERLTGLENVFHQWDNYKTSPNSHIDTASNCSCNDEDDVGGCGEDGDSIGSPVYEDEDIGQGSLSDGVVTTVEEEIAETGFVIEKVEKSSGTSGRRKVFTMNRMMLFSLVFVLLSIVKAWFSSGYFWVPERDMEAGFLTPT